MGDKKYVKLNPAKMGFTFLGVVPPKAQSLLINAFDLLKRDLGASWNSRLKAKEIFWINIWQDEDNFEKDSDITEISDRKIAKALAKWCRKAARRYCERKAIVDGYGFVVNPKGTQHYQPWHIDYTTDVAVVLIPLTPFTDKNATQCITLPRDTPENVLKQVASDVDQVDIDALMGELDCLIVQQVVAKPMSVLYMGRGTIHRGIPNTERDDRAAFFISVHFIKDYDKSYPYEQESLQGISESSFATFEKTR